MKKLFFIFILVLCCIGCKQNKVSKRVISKDVSSDNIKPVDVIRHGAITLYCPHFTDMDLVCENMPSPKKSNIIFCCEAAFTGTLLKDFKHSNIAGNHVSGGMLYKGYKCHANTGLFSYYDGRYNFAYDNYANYLDSAARHDGMAFGQSLIIYKGKKMITLIPKKRSSINEYRALCNLNDKLYIIDSNQMPYSEFVDSLSSIGVADALYLDMGTGWNRSWYRLSNGGYKYIHNKGTVYATNWLIFEE